MHCPQCGAEAVRGFNYCKQCGASLNVNTGESEEPKSLAKFMFMCLTFISISGLIGMFASLSKMAGRGIPPQFLIGIAVVSGVTIFGVVAVFAWLLMRLTGNSNKSQQELPAPQHLLQIPASPHERSSVTENTTRNFDPVYQGRNVRDTG